MQIMQSDWLSAITWLTRTANHRTWKKYISYHLLKLSPVGLVEFLIDLKNDRTSLADNRALPLVNTPTPVGGLSKASTRQGCCLKGKTLWPLTISPRGNHRANNYRRSLSLAEESLWYCSNRGNQSFMKLKLLRAEAPKSSSPNELKSLLPQAPTSSSSKELSPKIESEI